MCRVIVIVFLHVYTHVHTECSIVSTVKVNCLFHNLLASVTSIPLQGFAIQSLLIHHATPQFSALLITVKSVYFGNKTEN